MSQIELFGSRVIYQCFRITAQMDLTLEHDIGPVGDLQGFTDIMIRNQNSDTPLTQPADYCLNIIDRYRIPTGLGE